MRLNYFDLGLFDGKEIDVFIREAKKYTSEYIVHGFEAHPEYANKISDRFREEKNVHIHNLAIGDGSGEVNLYLEKSGHGNSIYPSKNNIDINKYFVVPSVSFTDWLSENAPNYKNEINVIRFNIEGAELPLIEQMVSTGASKHFDLFLGAKEGEDILKVPEISEKYDYYITLLRKNNIKIRQFCFTLSNNISLEPFFKAIYER